jgi:hypothetical protein
MKKYKGYYIDKVYFNNEQEIDKFLEEQALKAYKTACWLFNKDVCIETSIYASEKAQILVDKFGYTWEQVEQIEIEVIKAIA